MRGNGQDFWGSCAVLSTRPPEIACSAAASAPRAADDAGFRGVDRNSSAMKVGVEFSEKC